MFILGTEDCISECYLEGDKNVFPGAISSFLILKRTYKIESDGSVSSIPYEKLNKFQKKLSNEECHEDEIGESPRTQDDYLPPLEGFDLVVNSYAYTPEQVPMQFLTCSIQIADWLKKINVYGDRKYKEYEDGSIEITDAKEFVEMPIRSELAFGGEGYEFNPFGRGFVYSEANDELLSEIYEFKGNEELPADNEGSGLNNLPTDNAERTASLSDNIPELPAQNTNALNIDSPHEPILEVDLPNLEVLNDPFKNPYTAIDYAGFGISSVSWADKLSFGSDIDELSSFFTNFLEGNAGTDFYSYANEGQYFSHFHHNFEITFTNMRQNNPEFTLTMPSHYPRIHLACRHNDLELTKVEAKLNTVTVDLKENKLELIWKGYMELEGETSTAKDYNAKYLFVEFENYGDEKSMQELQIDFDEAIIAYEAAEIIETGDVTEALKAKFSDVKKVLVGNMTEANLPKEQIELVQNSQSPEQCLEIHENMLKIYHKKLQEHADELAKKTDDIKAGL